MDPYKDCGLVSAILIAAFEIENVPLPREHWTCWPPAVEISSCLLEKDSTIDDTAATEADEKDIIMGCAILQMRRYWMFKLDKEYGNTNKLLDASPVAIAPNRSNVFMLI